MDRPQFEVVIRDEKRLYFPEVISSKVLEKMKEAADKRTGKDIKSCVVTVPAYFNDLQKTATMDACQLAGL